MSSASATHLEEEYEVLSGDGIDRGDIEFGVRYQGVVNKIENFGIFVEIADDAYGLVHKGKMGLYAPSDFQIEDRVGVMLVQRDDGDLEFELVASIDTVRQHEFERDPGFAPQQKQESPSVRELMVLEKVDSFKGQVVFALGDYLSGHEWAHARALAEEYPNVWKQHGADDTDTATNRISTILSKLHGEKLQRQRKVNTDGFSGSGYVYKFISDDEPTEEQPEEPDTQEPPMTDDTYTVEIHQDRVREELKEKIQNDENVDQLLDEMLNAYQEESDGRLIGEYLF